MKYVKILGLAAVGAMASMAFVSAASATELYTTEPAGTPKTLGVGTEIDATLSSTSRFEDTKGNVYDTCTGGTIGGKLTQAGSATTTTKFGGASGGITWFSCTAPTKTIEGVELEIHLIPGTTRGTVTGTGFKVIISTVLFGDCTFTLGTANDLGILEGSDTGTAKLVVKAVIQKISGICESTGIWTGTYSVTKPDLVFVEEK